MYEMIYDPDMYLILPGCRSLYDLRFPRLLFVGVVDVSNDL